MSASKKLIFSAITLAFPLIVLLLIEAVLYALDRNNERFEFSVSIFSKFEKDGKPFYKVSHPLAYRGRNISFPMKKEEGAIRIFCLGESASAGWPHPPSEIYSEYLRASLEQGFPEHTIEVFNVSGHGFPSYRVRRVYEDVVKFDPDFIIIYTGNNEFLEIHGHSLHDSFQERLSAVRARLRGLRSFRYLEHLVIRAGNEFSSWRVAAGREKNPAILSKIRRQAIDLRKDDRLFKEVLDRYHRNVESMAVDAAKRGIPLLLLTVPVNLSDWRPNVSYNRLSGPSLKKWEHGYRLGRKAMLRENHREAAEHFREVIDMEPLHAESYFHLARAYARMGEFQSALENYQKARDLDYNPFRAIGAFNDSVRRVAASNGNVSLVDLERIFAENSAGGGGPGFDLFLDYVHPTKKGNLLIARAVAEALSKFERFRDRSGRSEPGAFLSLLAQDRSYDERDDIQLQGALLYVSAVMHQYKRMVEIAREIKNALARVDMTDSGLANYVSIEAPAGGTVSERRIDLYEKHARAADLALKVFPAYLELARDEALGLPMDPREKTEVLEWYRRYYDLMESGAWPVAENP